MSSERAPLDAAACEAAAAFGVSTMFEAAGRTGLVDLALIAHIPEAKVAGRARTVLCGQDDNLMVPAAIAHAEPGDVLVMRMPESRPVSLLGELLATQCVARGVVAVVTDAAIRDAQAIRALGLPVWSRYVRARSASKTHVGALDEPLEMGGTTIAFGDLVVLDGDGVLAIPAARIDDAIAAAGKRDGVEAEKRIRFARGELSYDIDGLRALVESARGPAGGGREPVLGTRSNMHNEDVERSVDGADDHEETQREAIVAADDTGLIQQQELLHEVEINDGGERSGS